MSRRGRPASTATARTAAELFAWPPGRGVRPTLPGPPGSPAAPAAAGAPGGQAAAEAGRERVNRPVAPRRGHRARGSGWAAVDATRRWPVYQAPSTEVGGLFPLLAANPLPAVGARMGYDALSGSAFYCHPIEWVLRGLATNPNLVVFGEPGR